MEAVVTAFIESITRLPPGSAGFERKVAELSLIGEREIRAISRMNARFAGRSDDALAGLFRETAPVARSLAHLRTAVERLDPSANKLVRRRPFGHRTGQRALETYLDRYADAEGHVRALVASLREGRAELERTNAAIAQERRSLSTQLDKLNEYESLARRLDQAVEQAAESSTHADPGRARALSETVLLAIRQRRGDILTHLAVASQSLAALEMAATGNNQLIRAIETATTTTVTALRTAVLVAQVLTNNHSVAAQLEVVNQFAAAVGSGATALARSSGAGQKADLASLLRAWHDVAAALDTVEAYWGRPS